MSEKKLSLQTTGQLREFLAMAMIGVKNGDMTIDKASQIHKLAGQINDSIYSEAKLAAFVSQAGGTAPNLGELPLGNSNISGSSLLPNKSK